MGTFKVSDLKVDGKDPADSKVERIYARHDKVYAVYRTRERVAVLYADDPALEQAQRTQLAPLNPLRGEINGLIDGWHVSAKYTDQANAARFDRRVADALVMAFENDSANAILVLQATKQELIEERTSRARFLYLLVACLTAMFWVVALWISKDFFWKEVTHSLWLAGRAGAVGAFFSIASAVRSRTILTDLRWRDNAADAFLRVTIGVIASVLFICILQSGVTDFQVGQVTAKQGGNYSWLLVIVLGFLAGFSERLVPDLLAKSLATTPPIAAPRPTKPIEAAPTQPGLAAPPGKDAQAQESGAGARSAEPAPAAAPVPPFERGAKASDEEDLDGCTCAVDAHPAAYTSDADLPAARGGVADAPPDGVAPGRPRTDDEDHVDGCDVDFRAAAPTPDEALPPAVGGVQKQ
jgi:hypothetical protein